MQCAMNAKNSMQGKNENSIQKFTYIFKISHLVLYCNHSHNEYKIARSGFLASVAELHIQSREMAAHFG